MKNISKYLLLPAALAFVATASFADDFGDFADFESDGDFDSTTDFADFSDFSDFADFGSFGSFGDDSSSGPKLETGGSVSTDVRAYVDTASIDNLDVEAFPAANLDMKYSGTKSDIELKLSVDENKIKNAPQNLDVIDELTIHGYFDSFLLEAGKTKVVWGKGDKLHVIDNFNADDYSDFIIPDYLDRRISTPMIRGVYSLPFANMQIEAVYTPFLPVDSFATDGRWTPAQVTVLSDTVTETAKLRLADSIKKLENARLEATTASTLEVLGTSDAQTKLTALVTAAYNAGKITADASKVAAVMATGKSQSEATVLVLAAAYKEYLSANLTAANTAYTLALANANALSADPSVIYPDMKSLKYGQFGGRLTATLGQIDFGVSYYNGWYKQPSVNASKINSFIASYLADGTVTEDEKFLAYDKKHTFGLEASTVIWHFNVRGEAAYNLTEDTDGKNPWVHNNSIAWLAGFDIDLPFWNANLNVQETGTFILHGDECDKNTADVDYAKHYSNNKIVCNFSTSFLNDKLVPQVTVMYGIERGDLAVMPLVEYKPDQNLTLSASGMLIWCKDSDSEFNAWKDNSFVALGAKYCF